MKLRWSSVDLNQRESLHKVNMVPFRSFPPRLVRRGALFLNTGSTLQVMQPFYPLGNMDKSPPPISINTTMRTIIQKTPNTALMNMPRTAFVHRINMSASSPYSFRGYFWTFSSEPGIADQLILMEGYHGVRKRMIPEFFQ